MTSKKGYSKVGGIKDESLTVYKSGNSKVITIPANWPINEGDEFIAEGNNQKLVLKKKKLTKKERIEKNLKEVDRLAGSVKIPGLEKLSTEDIEDIIDTMYDD